MHFPRKTLLAFAAALALFAARPALAQFSLGGHASYTKAKDADGTWAGGAQLRLRFPGPLGVEGLVDYRRTTYSAGGEDVLRIEQYPVQVSLMIFILPGQVQPYVLGGGGWYYTRSTFLGAQSALGSDTQHTFGGHVGGGVELGAKAKVSLHVDVRYVFLGVDSIDAIRDRYNNNPKADFW
ncbi:MAG TPA: outer membrane beta-barrel protein, partial [Thermoanaerobaculia bacterium]|nr:outer membrane beta-barrel protein [Thermoanaerobaculia bacterium]